MPRRQRSGPGRLGPRRPPRCFAWRPAAVQRVALGPVDLDRSNRKDQVPCRPAVVIGIQRHLVLGHFGHHDRNRLARRRLHLQFADRLPMRVFPAAPWSRGPPGGVGVDRASMASSLGISTVFLSPTWHCPQSPCPDPELSGRSDGEFQRLAALRNCRRVSPLVSPFRCSELRTVFASLDLGHHKPSFVMVGMNVEAAFCVAGASWGVSLPGCAAGMQKPPFSRPGSARRSLPNRRTP